MALNESTEAAFRVLVLCTGNSARSQIAEALLQERGATRAAGKVTARSAGSAPASHVNPHAIRVLQAHGIAWAGHAPASIDDVMDDTFELVITVCDNARDACPIFPRAVPMVHWGLPDPAHIADDSAARIAFEQTFDALQLRVAKLLALPLETLSRAELVQRATACHTTG